MNRTSHDTYRQKDIEDIVAEVEVMRGELWDRDERLRINNLRLENKTQKIIDLKQYLQSLGYRVVE